MSDLGRLAAQFVNSPYGVIALCSIIILAALGIYFIGFRPGVSRIAQRLREGTDALSKVHDPRGFAGEFETISSQLDSNELLGPEWRRFSRQLLFPESNESHGLIQTPMDPELHFHHESLIEPNLNLRFFSAVPNFLTGAGILGTFIGLVSGIYLASKGLDDPDIQVVKGSLQSLLNGASFAFLTSIAGLVSSILFSAAEKRSLHRLGVELSNWNEHLSKLLGRINPEMLFRSLSEETTRQTLAIERFSTEIAVSLADSLRDRLATSFGPAVDRIVQATETMAGNQVTAQEEMLRSLVVEFKQALSGAAGDEMAGLQRAFGELAQGLNGALAGLQMGQEQLMTATTRLTNELSAAVGKSLESFGEESTRITRALVTQLDEASASVAMTLRSSSDSASSHLTRTMERVAQAIEAMEHLVERSGMLVRTTGDASTGMQALVKDLSALQSQFASSAQLILAAHQQLARSADQVARASEQLVSSATVIGASSESVQRSLEASADAWSKHEVRFAGLDASLAQVFEQLEKSQAAHMQSVAQFVQGFDEHSAKALQSLSGVAKELLDAIEELSEARGPGR